MTQSLSRPLLIDHVPRIVKTVFGTVSARGLWCSIEELRIVAPIDLAAPEDGLPPQRDFESFSSLSYIVRAEAIISEREYNDTVERDETWWNAARRVG